MVLEGFSLWSFSIGRFKVSIGCSVWGLFVGIYLHDQGVLSVGSLINRATTVIHL